MIVNFETYEQDNGKYGVCIVIENNEVPVCYTDKVDAETEMEALQKTVTDGIFFQLFNQ